MTTLGLCKVLNAGLTHKKAKIYCLRTAGGIELTGTGNHPIFTKKGYVALDTISDDDTIMLWKKKRLYLMAERIIDGLKQSRERIVSTIGHIQSGNNRLYHFIEQYGKMYTAKYLKDMLSTILMKIHSIMTSPIFNLCLEANTPHFIQKEFVQINKKHFWTLLEKKLQPGINLKPVVNGIGNKQKKVLQKQELKEKEKYALSAEKDLKALYIRNIAHGCVGRSLVFVSQSISVFVNFVKKSFSHLGKKPNFVPERVIIVTEKGQADVYNLTVENAHNFIANGVLVHNCDAASGAYRMLAEQVPIEFIEVGEYGF